MQPAEPRQPDFEQLSARAREHLLSRLDRLPVGHVHTPIGAAAVLANEWRAVSRYCREQGIGADDSAELGSWHMLGAYDRISEARPDLLPPMSAGSAPPGDRGPHQITVPNQVAAPHHHRRSRPSSNPGKPVVAIHAWTRDRAIGLRAASLRWSRRQ